MAWPTSDDPVARLSRVQRWQWKRRERQIVGQFRRDQAVSLKWINGKRVLGAVEQAGGAVTAAIESGDYSVTMRGVTDRARRAFLEVSRYDCCIDGVGRYRDAWWIAVRPDPADAAPLGRVVVLASVLTVSKDS